MGVEEMRIIRTTESARWEQNVERETLGIAEYYDAMLDFASAYIQEAHTMTVEIWQFLRLMPEEKGYLMRPVLCTKGEYRDSLPVCRGNRGMVAIAADGNLYPCMQMSGTYMVRGKGGTLGNVKKDGLQKLLQEGNYLEEVCRTVGELAKKNEKCSSCPYLRACTGGCRALAEAFTWDKLGVDPTKCLFFEQGYPEKIREKIGTWKNVQEKEQGGKK